MKYRNHTGSLSDSMKTVKEFTSIEQIKEHLNKFYNHNGKFVEEIKFVYLGWDNRVNWDTYYVLMRLNNEVDFKIAGFSDGILKN